MRVLLNGSPYDTGTHTLSALLVELRLDDAVVATAMNGQFVAKTARDVRLAEGDAIEVLSPMQGG